MSFCKCDIIIQFAVHLYDCTLYERSLHLNCLHILKWFLHRSKIWAKKSLHVTSLLWWNVDSVMTCGAVLAQMPKGEKHFANTVPCNTGLSSQSHCSHFQTKTGHFLQCLSQTDCRCMHIYGISFFFVLSQLSLIHWFSFSLLLNESFLLLFQIFLTKLNYLHHSHYNIQFTVQAYIWSLLRLGYAAHFPRE